jgi:hypothetical protein
MPVIMPFAIHEREKNYVPRVHRVSPCISPSANASSFASLLLIPRSDQSTSDVPHRKDDAVDVVERHQWLGLAVRDITTSWSVLLEAWATLRTLGGWDIFMCSGTIGGCNSDFAD